MWQWEIIGQANSTMNYSSKLKIEMVHNSNKKFNRPKGGGIYQPT
jgi:hypothetical protein